MDFLKKIGDKKRINNNTLSQSASYNNVITIHNEQKSPVLYDKYSSSTSSNMNNLVEEKYNDCMADRIESYEHQLKSRSDTIQSLTDRIMDITIEYEEYKKQYNSTLSLNSASQQHGYNELQRNYSIAQSELESKRSEHKDMVNKLNLANERFTQLQNKYAEQTSELCDAQRCASNTLSAIFDPTHCVQQIQQLQQQCAVYNNELNKYKESGKTADANTSIDVTLNQQITSLQQQLTDRDNIIEQNKQQLLSLHAQLKETDNIKHQYSLIQSELDTYKSLNYTKSDDALQQSLDRCCVLCNEIETYKSEVNNKQQQINELTSKNIDIQNQLHSLKLSAEQHEHDISLLQHALADLRTLNAGYQQTITERTDTVTLLQTHCDSQITQISSLNNELAELHNNAEQLHKQYDQYKVESESALQLINNRNSELSDTLKSAESTLHTTQSQLTSTRQMLADSIQQYELLLATTKLELESARSALSDTQLQLNNTAIQLHTTSNEYAEYRSTATKQLSDLTIELTKKKSALLVYHTQIKHNAAVKQQQLAEQQRVAKLEAERRSKSLLNPLVSLLSKHKIDQDSTQHNHTINMFATSIDGNIDESTGSVSLDDISEEVAVSLSNRIQCVESEKSALQIEVNQLKRLLTQEKLSRNQLINTSSSSTNTTKHNH